MPQISVLLIQHLERQAYDLPPFLWLGLSYKALHHYTFPVDDERVLLLGPCICSTTVINASPRQSLRCRIFWYENECYQATLLLLGK